MTEGKTPEYESIMQNPDTKKDYNQIEQDNSQSEEQYSKLKTVVDEIIKKNEKAEDS